MRYLLAALCVVVAAGCGAAKTVQPVTLTQYVTQTIGDKGDPLAARAQPPTLRLVTRGGVQRGVPGSSCITYTAVSGSATTVCAHAPFPSPQRLSIVAPHERVRFAFGGSHALTLAVRELGCQRTLRRVPLVGSGRWRVDLPAGRYALLVSIAHFRAGARSGVASAGLGIWVSRGRRPTIVSVPPVLARRCGGKG